MSCGFFFFASSCLFVLMLCVNAPLCLPCFQNALDFCRVFVRNRITFFLRHWRPH